MIITQHKCIVGNDLADKVYNNIKITRHGLRNELLFTVDYVIGCYRVKNMVNRVYRLFAMDMTFRLRAAINNGLRRINRKQLEETV